MLSPTEIAEALVVFPITLGTINISPVDAEEGHDWHQRPEEDLDRMPLTPTTGRKE